MDFSYAQIEMARTAVPNAAFIQADMIEADLGEACYEGVCSYYAIIHIPREHHRAILAKVHRALVPGGLALLCLGANDIEEDTTDDYHGEPMYWSHFDGETYLAMLQDVGFTIDQDWLVSDATCAGAEHLFVLVSKKASP